MRQGEDIYKVASETPLQLRWLIERVLLPGAISGNKNNLKQLADIYDENFNPHGKVNLNCNGCINLMFDVLNNLVSFWKK